MPQIPLKPCSRKTDCLHGDGPELPLGEFNKNKARKDGLSHYCRSCATMSTQKWRQTNSTRDKEYYEDNKEVILAYYKERYQNNKEAMKLRNSTWKHNNPDKRSLQKIKCRTAKKQREVSWSNLEKIKQIYIDCKEINLAARAAGCMERFVVDHIVPLQGKLVSGLHVDNNLQIITNRENCSKHNKFTSGRNK